MMRELVRKTPIVGDTFGHLATQWDVVNTVRVQIGGPNNTISLAPALPFRDTTQSHVGLWFSELIEPLPLDANL